MKQFKALVVQETNGVFNAEVSQNHINDLPDNEILIKVHYSSLNYKDALSASGNKGVTRRYPHTPGIDCSGVVETSKSSEFKPGDSVIVTGFDLGMNTPGGFGQYICVPVNWVVPLPDGLDLKKAMAYGTAGFTAAQCVDKIVNHVDPSRGSILITGVTGGVGSISASILSQLGYTVAGVTGKPDDELLSTIGVNKVIQRDAFISSPQKALLREHWAGVIDTVGGDILVTAIKGTMYGGVIASCGNAASPELSLTVYPFILRGVTLYGIDSAQTPVEKRKKIWGKLACEWAIEKIEGMYLMSTLEQLPVYIENMLGSRLSGRVLVDVLGEG